MTRIWFWVDKDWDFSLRHHNQTGSWYILNSLVYPAQRRKNQEPGRSYKSTAKRSNSLGFAFTSPIIHAFTMLQSQGHLNLYIQSSCHRTARWSTKTFQLYIFKMYLIQKPAPLASWSKTWVCCLSLSGMRARIPPGGMDTCLVCVLRFIIWSSLWQADRSFRAVLPSVVCLRMIVKHR
jgi:hypothetical protein